MYSEDVAFPLGIAVTPIPQKVSPSGPLARRRYIPIKQENPPSPFWIAC